MQALFSRARTASTPSKSKHIKNKNDKDHPPLPPLSTGATRAHTVGDREMGYAGYGYGAGYNADGNYPSGGAARPRSSSLNLASGQGGGGGGGGHGQGQEVGFLPTILPADPHVPWAGSASATAPPTPSSPGGFLPPPPLGHSSSTGPRQSYGLLSAARDTVLGLPDVGRLVTVLCAQLEATGVATPFVFSSLALDVRKAGVVRLVNAFLKTCEGTFLLLPPFPSFSFIQSRFADEARFASAHELAMCLRWGLSRVVRVEGGREVRGLLSMAWYERWREEEAAASYPPTAFTLFLTSPTSLPPSLAPYLAPILLPLFALCNKLVAHSNESGHTPPTLGGVVSPVHANGKKKSEKEMEAEEVLWPGVEDFGRFGVEYLRSARAAEHLLLASIREGIVGAEGRGLGGPTRLREWVKMYPASLESAKTTGPRRGAKTTRIVHVRRNVRSYSTDLVRNGSTWASSSSSGTGPNDWASSKAWRNVLAGGAGSPRYAESYRKRMDLGVGVHPSTSSLSSSYSSSTSSAPTTYGFSGGGGSGGGNHSTYNLSAPSTSSLGSGEDAGGAFRSLTDLKWGEFESLGFGSGVGVSSPGGVGAGEGGIETKLKFDLTENARAERMAKRETLSWNDFSTAGFSRGDKPLSATLQFSAPLTLSLSSSTSPNKELNAELTRKLRKAHKALPAFGWDTAPVLGPEEVIEESFLDVFCDLLWGGGWMERAAGVGGPTAELAKECSWALVEYKSRSGAAQDNGTTVVLFEEFVPREYRLALAGAAPPGSRRRLPALFQPGSTPALGGKTWKQAATLNGRPYVVGATPAVTGSTRELDFESMIRGGGGTKVLSLGRDKDRRSTGPVSPEVASPRPAPLVRTRSAETQGSSTENSSLDKKERRQSARFRLPGGMIPGPSPGGGGARVRAGMAPAESAPVDFETRLAGESDDEETVRDKDLEAARQKRRESASDAWVDILVGSMSGRRMGSQDAEMPRGSARRRGGVVIKDDPDLAGLEAAQALAAETIGNRISREFSPDPDERLRDSDVVEIERVPRTSEQSDRSEASDGYGPATDEEEQTPSSGTQGNAVLSERHEARQQRRLGYFDLHPERRPPSIATQDDDPRSLLSGTDSDEEQEVEVTVPRNLDLTPRNPETPIRPLPTPTRATPVSPVSPAEVSPASNGHANNGNVVAAPKPTSAGSASKTSALIDMFRERERGTPPAKPAGPVPPSKLPVRTASREAPPAHTPSPPAKPPLPKTPPMPAAVGLPKSPAPVSPSAPAPLPAGALAPPMLDPPPPIAVESGRASPGRYIHGAPLHNVLEEEEEEV
ncbi:F-box domain-containing protein [Favolaschia claudopus]|uniref:F-box domain-containing protein n=1 Tax=Favolaschia claudopus TaxID=2862362 RepID=A0AAW0AWY6_9AGAR